MRGGFCNFMHLKPISYDLRRELYNRDHPWRLPAEQSPQHSSPAPVPGTLLATLAATAAVQSRDPQLLRQLARWKRKVTAAKERRAEEDDPQDSRVPAAYRPGSSSSSAAEEEEMEAVEEQLLPVAFRLVNTSSESSSTSDSEEDENRTPPAAIPAVAVSQCRWDHSPQSPNSTAANSSSAANQASTNRASTNPSLPTNRAFSPGQIKQWRLKVRRARGKGRNERSPCHSYSFLFSFLFPNLPGRRSQRFPAAFQRLRQRRLLQLHAPETDQS